MHTKWRQGFIRATDEVLDKLRSSHIVRKGLPLTESFRTYLLLILSGGAYSKTQGP